MTFLPGRIDCDDPSEVVQRIATSASTPVARTSTYQRWGKRALDLCLVALALPLVLTILIVLMIGIWLSGGSPLFAQDRIGLGGKPFRIWKLRTMQHNSEAVLARHLASDPLAMREWELTQKLQADPRVTRIGRTLRKTSLDELPQIWNVVRGEMSLVGPRPFLPHQQAQYRGRHYYEMRPGITGPWQISLRNESSFRSREAFDDDYYEDVSLKRDLIILAKTCRTVVRGTGV